MRSFTPKWCTTWLTSLVAMLVLICLAAPARSLAQDQPPYQDQQGGDQDDPPNRAARLSYTGGSVSFAPAGTDEWVNAVINRPMTTGDKLWTDQGARAELRVDSYAIRLGEQTGFSFLNLDDRTVQMRLTEGTVNVRVRRLDQDQVLEIDTPNLAFNVLRPGSYRVSVNENGDSTIINVRDGQGEVTGGGSAYPIHAGQSASFDGTDQLSADVEGYPGDDDFDRWCGDRDSRWEHSTSARYVSDDVVGYEDLDEYGGWRSVPDYGTVWFPHTTVVGWAPYRYGHWVWVSPWGWTWVDDAPWGFAPFHYGRWVVVGGVWGWVPVAPRPAVVTVAYVRPVYAPALVAWVGGPRFGVGVAVGGVGAGVAWFPLGPRDVYCPSYHVTERYVERVNVYNTTIINRVQVTNVYRNVYVNKNVTNITYQNQRYGNAVTATSRESFTSAQPIGRNMMRVDAKEMTTAQVSPMTPGVAPQQRSFLGASQQARVRPPANVVARQVVAKTAPPPAVVPVDRQLQEVQANGGRPVAASQIRQNNVPRNNVRVAQEARPAQLPPPGQRMNNRPGQPNQPQGQQNNGRLQQNQPPVQVQPNNNRPVQQNIQQNQQPAQVQPNNNRPVQQNQPPAQVQPNNNRQNNQPNQPQAQPDNRGNNNRNFNDRPPTSRPTVNPQVEQRQQQQLEKLRQQQDQERQKLEQKQVQQNQKLEQQNNQQRQQQEQQRQQQQLEQMERKHDQQQQKMQQRQQQEAQKQQRQQAPPPKDEKPPKSDNKDRPH